MLPRQKHNNNASGNVLYIQEDQNIAFTDNAAVEQKTQYLNIITFQDGLYNMSIMIFRYIFCTHCVKYTKYIEYVQISKRCTYNYK